MQMTKEVRSKQKELSSEAFQRDSVNRMGTAIECEFDAIENSLNEFDQIIEQISEFYAGSLARSSP